MTNKPLILGVVTSLALAGGHANAQVACPAEANLSTVLVSGFSCTLGDKLFSGFSSSLPGALDVSFAMNAPVFAVSVFRSATFFPNGNNTFNYTISVASGAPPDTTMIEHTLGADVSMVPVSITDSLTGNNSGTKTFTVTNGGTMVVPLSPGDTSVDVMITTHQTGHGMLNSFTNDFTQSGRVSVPEPMSLALFGLGLAGLALARRWRS